MLRLITYTILAIGILTNLGFMLSAGNPEDPSWWPFFIGFAIWVILPYAAVTAAAYWFRPNHRSRITLLIAAILLTLSSILLLYIAFIANPDPQSGLILVVLPIYQWIVTLPFIGLAGWLQRRRSPSPSSHRPN